MIARHSSQKGFTIVELLIVIVVIGILAAITVVAYNGIQQRALNTTLTTNLANAAKQMGVAYANNGTYPTTIPSDMKYSSGVGMSLANTGDATTFCINAQLTTSNDVLRMYYDSGSSGVATGVCSGTTISGSEAGVMKPNLISSPEFTSGWSMGLSVAGQAITTSTGAAGDPYPTKPVLIWTNDVARTTSWAVLAGSVNYSQITLGKTYQMNYWVRKTGTGFTGNSNVFGVMDGSTTNKAINTGANQTVNTTWTKVTGSSVAIGNGISSNKTYSAITTAPFATTGWTLEFQGFELTEQ
jgi:prepilin-type N-terminal cleavage/methylation domain-containing protein